MPVGLQLTAPAGAEERLLAIALTAERGWAPRRTGSERRRCSLREIAAGSPSSSSLRSAKLPIAAVLRSRRLSETRGFIKVLVEANGDRILGFTMIGSETGEVMAVVQTAMLAGLPHTRLRDAMIAHPTMAEGLTTRFANLLPR
jgi:hypothetical protein